MQRGRILLLISGALFFLWSPTAFANTTVLSTNPSFAAQPFSYYCQPYKFSFEDGKHYIAQDGACTYSVPSAVGGSQRRIALFKGVPGNSTFVAGDQFFSSTATLIQEDNTVFGAPAQDDQYFAVIYGANSAADLNQFHTAFTVGSSTDVLLPSDNYRMVQWRWGAKQSTEYDPVVIIPGILGSWQKNGEWIIDPILHTYDNLIDTFLANGYVKDKTLFTFPYDWEEPNEVSAHLLANKISQVKQTCGCNKVDIIAHSMGGLVALYYAENDEYKDDIDQLFLVATPLLGAPYAYNTWEGGVIDFGDIRTNLYLATKFSLEARKNGYSNIFDYIQHKPIESIYELLPVYTYLSTDTTAPQYPDSHPINGFIEAILKNLGKIIKTVRIEPILADNLLDNTASGFVIKPSTQLPKWPDGEPTQTQLGPGDGTVPRMSIENIFAGSAELQEFDGVDHTQVASSSAPYIFREINGKDPNPIIGIQRGNNIPLLLITLFSPIDMEIIAPDGKKLGKDLSTNSEVDEIPDAFYSGFTTDNEYAVIVNPLPGTYTIKTVGTGSGGKYTIVTDYITTATTTEAEVVGSTTPAQIIDHTLVVSPTSTIVTITANIPTPPASLTPDSCLSDIKKAYQDKWISKKTVYEGLAIDCRGLRSLFEAADKTEKIAAGKRNLVQKALLAATQLGIKLTINNMDLLAKDKGNTKDGVELIHKYTTWFRKELNQ